MAPDIAIRPARTRRGLDPRTVGRLTGLLAAALFFGIVPRMFVSPATVAQLRLVNQTPYALDVEVTDAQLQGWTAVGTAEPAGQTVIQDVIDQGNSWVFHFSSQGEDGGEVHVTKAELTGSGWQVVIPSSVGTQLQREGAPPPPAITK